MSNVAQWYQCTKCGWTGTDPEALINGDAFCLCGYAVLPYEPADPRTETDISDATNPVADPRVVDEVIARDFPRPETETTTARGVVRDIERGTYTETETEWTVDRPETETDDG